MKPAPFDYLRPDTVAEAVDALATAGAGREARLLAGGQSLVPLMNLRLARPSLLVDLAGLAALNMTAIESDGTLAVGAMVSHERLGADPVVMAAAPLLAEASRWIGHTAIRVRGTIGGSLAHADPAAELPVVALVLDTTFEVGNPRGGRTVAAGEFCTGPFTTVLAGDELLTAVRVPAAPPGRRCGFAELSRRHGDFALVVVAAVVDPVDPAGPADPGAADPLSPAVAPVAGPGQAPVAVGAVRVRIGVGGAGPVPLLVTGTFPDLDEGVRRALAEEAAAAARPVDDVHAPASYRRVLVATLVTRALSAAMGAGPEGGRP